MLAPPGSSCDVLIQSLLSDYSNVEEQRSFGSFIKSPVVTRSTLLSINSVLMIWFQACYLHFTKGRTLSIISEVPSFRSWNELQLSLGIETLLQAFSSTQTRLAINNEPVSVLSCRKGNGWSYLKFHGPLWTYLSFNMEKPPDHLWLKQWHHLTTEHVPWHKEIIFLLSELVFFVSSSWLN